MGIFQTVLNTLILLILYFLIGIVAKKSGVIQKQAIVSFADFVLMVTLPCTIFNSFSIQLTKDTVQTATLIFFAAIGICIGTFLLGKILYVKYPWEQRSVMAFGTLISNCAFAGMPLIGSIYGELGVLYASIAIIPYRIFFWTGGVSYFEKASFKENVKKILLNPCLIACWLGAARMLLKLPVPALLNAVISNVGACSGPVSMVVVGAILADTDIRTCITKGTLYLTTVRLVLIPLLINLVLTVLGVNLVVRTVSVLIAAMPLPDTCSVMATKYGADVDFGAKATLLSTLLSLVTVPLIALLL